MLAAPAALAARAVGVLAVLPRLVSGTGGTRRWCCALAASRCHVRSRLLHQSVFTHLHRLVVFGGEPGLLHLVRLVLPGQVGAEVVDADEVAAGRLGPVQLQCKDLVCVPASGGGQVLVLRGVVVVLWGVVVGVVRCVERAELVDPWARRAGVWGELPGAMIPPCLAPLAGSPSSSPSRSPCRAWVVASSSVPLPPRPASSRRGVGCP